MGGCEVTHCSFLKIKITIVRSKTTHFIADIITPLKCSKFKSKPDNFPLFFSNIHFLRFL